MEADGLTLTDEQIRDRFSAYHDGELPEAEAVQVRARLERDPALAAEYEAFKKLMGAMASLSLDDGGGDALAGSALPPGERVDLLAGVQSRLHKRSGGRFYGTRLSRIAGIVPLEIAAAGVLLLLLLAYASTVLIGGVERVQP